MCSDEELVAMLSFVSGLVWGCRGERGGGGGMYVNIAYQPS